MKDTLSLLKNNSFLVFIIYVLGMTCIHFIFDQQFSV
ncbi:MFS transporter [Priestia flexa]